MEQLRCPEIGPCRRIIPHRLPAPVSTAADHAVRTQPEDGGCTTRPRSCRRAQPSSAHMPFATSSGGIIRVRPFTRLHASQLLKYPISPAPHTYISPKEDACVADAAPSLPLSALESAVASAQRRSAAAALHPTIDAATVDGEMQRCIMIPMNSAAALLPPSNPPQRRIPHLPPPLCIPKQQTAP